MYCSEEWQLELEAARSDALVEIQGRLLEVKLDACDTPVWLISRKQKYTSSDAWEEIRGKILVWIGGRLYGSF